MDLRELNYILLPRSNETWARWSDSRLTRWAGRIFAPLAHLTREGQVLAVALLVTGAAGVDVHFSHLYLVFCGLLGLLTAAFVCRPFANLRGVELQLDRPARVAAGEPIELTAVIRNRGPRAVWALRLQGPFLPWDGAWIGDRPAVGCVAPGEEARVPVSLRFDCRGDRLIGRFDLMSVRPLGLMGGTRRRSAPIRVMVVPQVRRVEGLPLPRESRDPGGERGRRWRAGESFELLGVRPYRPGDRLRDLHGRTWARLGVPMVREYREEERARAAVFFDPTGPEGGRDVFDLAVSVAASLTAWLAASGTPVDLSLGGQSPRTLAVEDAGRPLDAALDALAVVPAAPGEGPPTPPRLGAEAVFFVCAGWDTRQAARWAAVALGCAQATLVVVSAQAPRRAQATAAGARAIDPAKLRGDPHAPLVF